MSEAESINDVAALTVQLLSAYPANNSVASEDLAGLIRSTHCRAAGGGTGRAGDRHAGCLGAQEPVIAGAHYQSH
jgi:predicted transcriptional regulator